MLNVQIYLHSLTKINNDPIRNLEALKMNLGIEYKIHPNSPLVILDYCQLNSPKTHPVVKECRGLVLELGTWEVIAKGFDRFFNLGEALELTEKFNWDNFYAKTKEDGSYIMLYHYKDDWYVKTRNSFGDGKLQDTNLTWKQLFLSTLKSSKWLYEFDKNNVGIFELCSTYNKVVRHYQEPTSFLLGVYNRHKKSIDYWCDESSLEMFGVYTPETFYLKSMEEVEKFITNKSNEDKTYEGLVLTDSNGLMLKVKSKTYLSLHRMKGNDNVFRVKNLLPFVLTNETDELLAYYPEVETLYREVEAKVNDCFNQLLIVFNDSQGIENQKDFAMLVKNNLFSGILFKLRKKCGVNIPLDKLKEEWSNHEDMIYNILFKQKDV